MYEFENAYVLDYESAKQLMTDRKYATLQVEFITDNYLSKNIRVRKSNTINQVQYFLTEKKGDKKDGVREEETDKITESQYLKLKQHSQLEIIKEREYVANSTYQMSFDFIQSPMRLAIVELESNAHYVTDCFLNKMKICPLSAFDLFKRHIGVCGTASAGKSETARKISHILNTQYNAKSFHVVEFATTFIQKYNRTPKFEDQLLVWLGQRDREINSSKSNIVISDCPSFLSYIYMLWHKEKPVLNAYSALQFSKIYKKVLFDLVNTYTDIVFLKLKQYAENNIRYQNKQQALDIENKILGFLNDHQVKYISSDYTEATQLIDQLFYINYYQS